MMKRRKTHKILVSTHVPLISSITQLCVGMCRGESINRNELIYILRRLNTGYEIIEYMTKEQKELYYKTMLYRVLFAAAFEVIS